MYHYLSVLTSLALVVICMHISKACATSLNLDEEKLLNSRPSVEGIMYSPERPTDGCASR